MTEKVKEQPIDRIFAVLDALVRARRPITLAEISVAIDVPPPSVHRIVGILEERGLLKRAMNSRMQLLPGPRLVQMSRNVLEAAIVADEPHVILEELASETREYCQIGAVTEGEVRYIDAVRARRTFGLQLEQGNSAPLHCTSMGKLFLASMDDKALANWLKTNRLEQLSPHTITVKNALVANIKQIRKLGWAASDEEYGVGVVGCAVAIPTAADRPFFAVGISAPAAHVPYAKLPEFIDPLRRAAQRIAESMMGEA